MDLQDLRKLYIIERLGIKLEDFGRAISFVDFGNVNHWFEEDRQDHLGNALADDQKLSVDLAKLKQFTDLISGDTRFYYGHDGQSQGSLDFIRVARDLFGKHRVITKQVQKVRHHLSNAELTLNTRQTSTDGDGIFIRIPKCNFDVEIAIDAVRLMDKFDTVCLFSGDADFVPLIHYLKQKGKRIILIKGGHIVRQLKEASNMVISAQNIKEYIADIKQKPGVQPGLADRTPVSTGRTTRRS